MSYRSATKTQEQLDRIRQLDLAAVSIDVIQEAVSQLLDGWTLAAPTIPSGQRLFRARQFSSSTSRNSVRDFSYPPSDVCRMNRANRTNNQLFYCSADRGAAVVEMQPEVGACLGLMHYRTSTPLLVTQIGFRTQSLKALLSPRSSPPFADLPHYSRADRLIADFLSDTFCERIDKSEAHIKYKLSVAIAGVLLGHAPESVRGLMYPTVAMAGKSDNLALRTYPADCFLKPFYVEFFEITEISQDLIRVKRLDEARRFARNGAISWLGHQGSWRVEGEGAMLLFEFNDHRWVARDAEGRIIDPK